ncbi:TAXI family TRAP transporter solute-binding subunit [Jeotgalibacillus proteolyticus]|uniref:C4-dicarboxylate ABC transporter substrate-binding protein n=1 Tax=Jeotgalibacillus proteolyticus TaxID=2082395 RepID=A0A2S5GCU5_9BACL|nr:C4-dicarboxylate ABC transporter substrate-binding protein [Jeotgalibacillus proteolyticus]
MKYLKQGIIASMVLMLAACGSEGGSAGGNQYITIATASTGGTYYPIGVGIGNLWSQELKDEGINASGQSSAGSVENIDLMKKGEADFSILQGLIASQAYNGEGSFEGNAYEDLRTVAMIWPNVEHFVLKDNQIDTGTISDIEGKTFSVGPQASGTEESTLVMMEGLGLTKENIKPEYLGYDDTISAMRDGRLDGGSLPAGVPVAAITDMYASNVGASVLEITDEQFEQISAVSNAWYQYTIPAETYPNQTEDIETIAQPNILAASIDLDDDTVYMLTKTMYENLDFIYGVHNSAKEMTLETALDGLPAPLHNGAYRFFEEEGIEVPDELIPPEAE